MSLSFDAMTFARHAHRDQVRKYTGEPYACHLAEVTAIAMSAGWHNATVHPDTLMAVCWLHDCVEDCGVTGYHLAGLFGMPVAEAVMQLSDLEAGTRAARKAASRIRLAAAPSWVQTIKCADLISNTQSIVQHDPKFAVTYLEEKRLLLDVLTKADTRLWAMARSLAGAA